MPTGHRRRGTRTARHGRAALSTALLATVVALSAHTGAQSGRQTAVPDAYPNFDIRTDRAFAPDGYLDRVASQTPIAASDLLGRDRIDAIARLVGQGTVDVTVASELGTLEVISATRDAAFLRGASSDRVNTLRGFIAEHSAALALAPDQIDALEVVADYVNPSGNLAWTELEQRLNGLPVFRGYIRGAFTPDGALVRTTGQLAPGLIASSLASAPSVSAADALSRAAASVGWDVPAETLVQKGGVAVGSRITFERGTLADEPAAWLLYFPFGSGTARLAWATEIWGDPQTYLVVVDAEDGTLLFRKSLTESQTQSATYVVYNDDSPAPSSPTSATPGAGFQAPYIARQAIALIGNEGPNTFNNLGWITDGGNVTAGNNVEAGVDRVAPDGIDATVTGVSRVFNFSYNPETEEPLTTLAYERGAVVNLFYWTNRYHDLTYLLGFTEQARNYQHDNFGRGGAANDRISAEAQDASGTNNANFSVGVDGTRGRMQMFIWTGPTPDREGALDRDIIWHELTHGLSNRLHANATGLNSNMSRGMGEGWSDFYMRALGATADEDVNGVYALSGWATRQLHNDSNFHDNYYYGIRRFPYAVRAATGGPLNRPHNPLTFADIDATQINISEGAYPKGPGGSGIADQVHNLGEVWAIALLEVRARFITRLGFAEGNRRILQVVTDAMKANPANPTFLQGRDSILAMVAANPTGTPEDIADVWAGFATRGMGMLASIESPGTGGNDARVTESFLKPGDPVPTFSINDVSFAEGNGGTTTATFTVSTGAVALNAVRVSFATADSTASSVSAAPSVATPISVPSSGAATPYPAPLVVSSASGPIQNLRVRLEGISHVFPGDLDILLVGPGGQKVVLMSDAGGTGDLVGASLTFADGAAPLPESQITPGGTYAPTDLLPGDTMEAPAPGGPYGTSLAVFNNTDPNGTWSLFVQDDLAGFTGSLTGYTLLISGPGSDYVAKSGELVFAPGTTAQTFEITINGDATQESDETFFINLSNPIGGLLGDPQAIGTILSDDGPPPVSAGDSFVTTLNTPLTVPAPGVLANDNSNGIAGFSAVLVSPVSSGTLLLNSNGGFNYTPAAGFVGSASFTYRSTTIAGPGNTATVTIAVNPLAPSSSNDTYATSFNTALVVGAPGILANDNSNGGGGLTAAVVSGVSNGTLTLATNGAFVYEPAAAFVGSDSFTYRATNIVGAGNLATVTLNVATAPPPTAASDAFSTSFNAPLVIPAPGVLANDTTNGGGPMTAVLVTTVANGTLALAPNGGFSYTPSSGFSGTDSFTYRTSTAGGGLGNVAAVTLTVNEPATPQPPTSLVVSSIVGNLVTFRWTPPAVGPAPTGYVVAGGLNPGEVLASLPTGQSAPIFSVTVPVGAFYVRVHTLAGGVPSDASNEIRIFVNVPVPPSAPANLLGAVNGSALQLAWRNTFGGGAPAAMMLDVSGSANVSLPLGAIDTFSATVAPGTYTFSVRATNVAGSSPASNAVTLNVPAACSGVPLAPANFLAYKVGNTIHVVWDPPASGPAPSGYVIQVTGSANLTLPLAARSISGAVPPGTYNLHVSATNACGTGPATAQTITVP